MTRFSVFQVMKGYVICIRVLGMKRWIKVLDFFHIRTYSTLQYVVGGGLWSVLYYSSLFSLIASWKVQRSGTPDSCVPIWYPRRILYTQYCNCINIKVQDSFLNCSSLSFKNQNKNHRFKYYETSFEPISAGLNHYFKNNLVFTMSNGAISFI